MIRLVLAAGTIAIVSASVAAALGFASAPQQSVAAAVNGDGREIAVADDAAVGLAKAQRERKAAARKKLQDEQANIRRVRQVPAATESNASARPRKVREASREVVPPSWSSQRTYPLVSTCGAACLIVQ